MRAGERFPAIIVLADDVTGALASAARLSERGFRTVVEWAHGPGTSLAEALVVNMGNRENHAQGGLQPEANTPRARYRSYSRRLRELGGSRFELRLDSTFRGQHAEEMAGLLEGSGMDDPWVLVVPAYPSAGRITRQGKQVCFSADMAEQEIVVADALFPDDEVRVIDLKMVRAGPDQVVEAMRQAAEAGVRRFVADAAQERDLQALAQAAALIEQDTELVTASPGAWLRYHPHQSEPSRSFLIVAVGALTEVNARQLRELQDARPVSILDPTEATNLQLTRNEADDLLAGEPTIVIVAEQTADLDSERLQAAADVAGSVQALLDQARTLGYRCKAIVASGAFTSQLVAKGLDAENHHLEPLGEALPLCPVGRLAGGPWTGLPVALKGGLIGQPEALVALVEQMWNFTSQGEQRAGAGERAPG